jgi:magnesium transporter
VADAPENAGGSEPAPEEIDRRLLASLIAALADGDGRLFGRIAGGLHPADAADLLEQLSWEQFESALRLSPKAFSPEILSELEDEHREEAIKLLPASQLAKAVTELESDDATLLVEQLDEQRREEVLAAVPDRDREEVLEGLSFDEETAGRLMQREFVCAPEHWTVGDAIDHLRAAGEDDLPDTFFEIYIVDAAFRPIGAVPLSTLMRARREIKLATIMHELRARISPEIDQEEAAYLFAKYHLAQAPVVDEAGRLKGMLTVDDIVDVIQEENAEDMLALAGVSEGSVASTALEQVRARAPWLVLSLVALIGASFIISLFAATIEELVALAILMPIVSALGGNAGAQTLTIIVRAMTARELTGANTPRTIAREAASAAMIGVILAVLLAVVAFVWFRQPMLAVVIAIALTGTIVWGGLMGVLVPLGLKRLGADPAVASSAFVTATTDMVGFFLFLGLATVVLL